MKRQLITPRPDFGNKLESIGLSFHSWDNYWNEGACYRFTAREIDEIEAATEALHAMYMNAMRKICADRRLGELGIPAAYHQAVEQSFRNGDFSVYGRFDLAYDGKSPPRMLEYNADTPTSLLESAVAQWYWMEDCFPQHDQFNSLHERLIERWKALPGKETVHVASLAENEEDWVCTTYMQDCITQAGRATKHIFVEDIGWDNIRKCFVDLENQPITTLFKLYPWEWIMQEPFGPLVPGCATRFVEPLWKSALSSKAMLPILWEMYPDHPNLLPAYFDAGRLSSFARKPFFSREGANVELHKQGEMIAHDTGPYGAEGYVYQELCLLPQFDGKYPVIGSWVVDGQPAGMCVREDISPITTNMSNFVPHYFTKDTDEE